MQLFLTKYIYIVNKLKLCMSSGHNQEHTKRQACAPLTSMKRDVSQPTSNNNQWKKVSPLE